MSRIHYWFDILIPDELARTMTREQYYAARSWARRCRRLVAAQLGVPL